MQPRCRRRETPLGDTRAMIRNSDRGVQSDMRFKTPVVAGVGLLVLLAAVAGLRPAHVDLPRVSRAQKVLDVCPPIVDPPEAAHAFGHVESWQRQSWLLRELGERALACGPSHADEVYRLAVVYSHSTYSPFVVRVERSDRRVTVSGSVFQWVHGTPMASLKRTFQSQRSITESEWSELVAAIENAGFWTMEHNPEVEGLLDGSTWLIEGRRDRGHHIVEYQTSEDGSFRSLALSLIRLAGLRVPEVR